MSRRIQPQSFDHIVGYMAPHRISLVAEGGLNADEDVAELFASAVRSPPNMI